MEDRLYVRIRGRVQGPFEIERLQALVRRGQVSRMHEVSADQSNWRPAGDHPELFQPHQRDESVSAHRSTSEDEGEFATGGEDATWYYAKDGEQHGPVTLKNLRVLASQGIVDASDLVWTDGMSEWLPAIQTPLAASLEQRRGQEGAHLFSADLRRTLSESRSWVVFIATFLFVIAALLVLLGSASIVVGARDKNVAAVAGGGFSLFYGVVCGWGANLLSRYVRQLRRFGADKSDKSLDRALRALTRFWIFLSIVFIVLAVNSLAVLIWVLSVGLIGVG